MSRSGSLLLLLVLLVGCAAPPDGTPTPENIVSRTARPTATRTATPTPTMTPWSSPTKSFWPNTATVTPTPTPCLGPCPTATVRPTRTATRTPAPPPTHEPLKIGSFVVTRPFTYFSALEAAPPLPAWIHVASDEAAALERARADYKGARGPKAEDAEYYADSAADFLAHYPDGDGAIVVWALQGHWLNYAYSNGRTAYSRVIELFMQRRPERRAGLVDDLIELGLPIDWATSTDLGRDDFEVLLFSYHLSRYSYSGPAGLFALVRDGDAPWRFTPVPIWWSREDHWTDAGPEEQRLYGIPPPDLMDLNADGTLELVIDLRYLFSGDGVTIDRLQVLGWSQQGWTDLLAGQVAGKHTTGIDLDQGRFWVEDADGNGVSEIVIERALPRVYIHGLLGARGVDVYQWNDRILSSALPLPDGGCAYHALAAAQQRLAADDPRGSLAWWHTFRRRAAAESASPESRCQQRYQNDWWKWRQEDISYSYTHEADALEQLLGTTYAPTAACPYYAGVPADHPHGLTEIPQRGVALSGTVAIRRLQLDLVACNAVQPYIAGRLNWSDTALWWRDYAVPQAEATCAITWFSGWLAPSHADVNGDGLDDLHQTTSWECTGLGGRNPGATLETTCLWNGTRYAPQSSRVVTATPESAIGLLTDLLPLMVDCGAP